MLYTIGEMAKRLNIPASTLRFYDKEGLLPFVERSKGGIRVFRDADYECLRIVECLKKTGMPLRDIKSFIQMTTQGDETIEARLKLFRLRKEAVEQQLAEIQETLRMIAYKCWYYETAAAAGTTAVPEQMDIRDVPEAFRAIRKELSGWD